MNKIYWIYLIKNLITGKLYIGLTGKKNPYKRWAEHTFPSVLKKSKQRIHKSIKKYGKENFSFKPIFQYNNLKEAETVEIFLIKKLNLTNLGYNLDSGGKLKIPSSETLKKMSIASKGRASFRGKKHSKQSKEKIKKAILKQIALNGPPFKNKKHTSESKIKCGIQNKGKTWKLIDGKRVWLEK